MITNRSTNVVQPTSFVHGMNAQKCFEPQPKISTSQLIVHAHRVTTVNNKLAASTSRGRLRLPGSKQSAHKAHGHMHIHVRIKQIHVQIKSLHTHHCQRFIDCYAKNRRWKWPYDNDPTANWWCYIERHAWYTSARTLSRLQRTQQVYMYITNSRSKVPQNSRRRN